MQITPSTSAPAVATIAPPARWARWGTTPLARVDYGQGGSVTPWAEAWLATDRGITGARNAAVLFGGRTEADAITAAHLLAAKLVDVQLTSRSGKSTRTIRVNPAIGVLRDSETGVWWLATLRTTFRSGEGWVDAPHSIDGAAFEGKRPSLRTPTVLGASPDLVAVVGRDTVIRPNPWRTAPDDARRPGRD